MNKHDVHDTARALAYIVDCTLATVSSMAMKKSRPKYEYQRQINIAQQGVDWMIQMDVEISATRAAEIIANYGGSVKRWASQYEE